jgi:hypothetical protein
MTKKSMPIIVKDRPVQRIQEDEEGNIIKPKRVMTEEQKAFNRKTLERARQRKIEIGNLKKFEKEQYNKEIDNKLEKMKKIKEQEQKPNVEEEEIEDENPEIIPTPIKPKPIPRPQPKKKVIKQIIVEQEENDDEEDEEEEEEIIVKKIIKKQPAKQKDLYQLSNEDMLRRELNKETKNRVLSNLFNF